MKRDPDLLRSILLAVEELPAGHPIKRTLEIQSKETPDEATFLEHIRMLIEEPPQMLRGQVTKDGGKPHSFSIVGLTSAGHDFLDSTRDDRVWRKTKDTIQKSGGGFTLRLLSEVATQLVAASIRRVMGE